jgi:hypothetical protein
MALSNGGCFAGAVGSNTRSGTDRRGTTSLPPSGAGRSSSRRTCAGRSRFRGSRTPTGPAWRGVGQALGGCQHDPGSLGQADADGAGPGPAAQRRCVLVADRQRLGSLWHAGILPQPSPIVTQLQGRTTRAMNSGDQRSHRTAVGAFVGRNTDAESGDWWPGFRSNFPSTFPPPDALPRGTGRYRWGRRVTAGAVSRVFVLVTADGRGPVGMRGDLWCDAVKSPAYAYPGSNPGPATNL